MSQSQPPVSEFHAAGGVSSERHGELSVIQDVQRKRRDTWKLSADIEQRRRKLQSVCDEIDRLNEHYESVKEEYQGYDPFLKDQEAKQAARTAETERQSTVRQREELQRLKTDKTQLMERHQRLKLELEGLGEFTDMMSRLPKFTNFKDVDALTEYMESLIHFKDELVEKEQEAQEQVDRMKKERAAVTKQHHLLQMQRNNELALMRTELEDTQAEAVLLEKQWLHVQETAAKKTLQLGQIKISTFNLAQMIRLGLKEEEEGEGGEEGQGAGGGGGGGEEDVWADKTESQLDRIMTFVEDYSDSVKRYQITIGPLDAEFNLGQQDNKKKQRGATRSKKKQ